ncbi:MAG: hypothetical protein OHK006_20420 [Thermodesulfovibrionales bacterium]
MEKILQELRTLNALMQRIADRYAVRIDPSVLDSCVSFAARNVSGSLLLRGIGSPDPVRFAELRGIDRIIRAVRQNTEQFLEGLPCNNALLYGPRGTGKSSVVKALLNAYRARGLRMIEMPQETLLFIEEVAEIVRTRSERYIVFCDDLSFGADETVFRRLKSVLEGGLEARPRNMLIYATSNRRHLLSEKASDNVPVIVNNELHPADTLEENLSLSDRFGLRLGFNLFGPAEYLDIVRHSAAVRGLTAAAGSLDDEAMRWAADHGSFSGRTARQFVDQTEGRLRASGAKRRRSRRGKA